MTIGKDQVYEVADSLSENGNIPSAIKIREILKTGSLGTIQKYLKLWRHKETLSDSLENPPPEQILEATTQYVNNFWGTALHHARKEAMVKIQEAQQAQKVAEKDSESAWEAVEKIENKISELMTDIDKMQIEKDQFIQEIKTIKQQNEENSDTIDRLIKKADQLEIENKQKDDKISEINHTLSDLKNENLTHINTNEKLKIENAMNSKDIRGLRENNDKLILQINSERDAKQSLTYDLKIQEEQNRNLKTDLNDLKKQNYVDKEKSDLQIAELSKLHTQLDFIKKELNDSKIQIENLEKTKKENVDPNS